MTTVEAKRRSVALLKHNPGGHTPLSARVFRHVGRQIAEGTLPPGHAIDDTLIGSDLGVSRTPVREGLQRLERIGLIEFSPGRFTRVTDLTTQDVAHWREYAGHQFASLAGVVAIKCAEGTCDRVAHTIDEVADAVGDPERFTSAYLKSFVLLLARAGNTVHQHLLSENSFALTRALRAWAPEAAHRSADSFHQLSAALRAGDAELVQRAARNAHLIDAGLDPRQ